MIKSSLGAVILNDTRAERHFGCSRVMRAIEKNLQSRHISILRTSPVGSDWTRDRNFLAAMNKADIVIINGEGTLHHGQPYGELLLKVVEHQFCTGKPTVLINALYQDNPDKWKKYLDRMSLISTRDSWSAQSLRHVTGRDDIYFALDLSLANGVDPSGNFASRSILTMGESVIKNDYRALLELSHDIPDMYFLPIVTRFKGEKKRWRQPWRGLREIYINCHATWIKATNPRAIYAAAEPEYVDAMLKSIAHASGRFHAICIALTTKTPFVALSSNSWKIEALFKDVGIDTRRLVNIGDVRELMAEPSALSFGDEEWYRIESALIEGEKRVAAVFDNIAELANARRG